MSDLRDAARQALEALEELNGWQSLAPPLASQAGRQAAINLRAALEQPEQEQPVANNPDPYHLSRILHELAGSASMCWDHVDRAGVFQSTQAADVVAAAIAEIRQRMKDAPPRCPNCASLENQNTELRRLHALNGELLEALKGMFDQLDLDGCIIPAVLKARAAIAKAEGEV